MQEEIKATDDKPVFEAFRKAGVTQTLAYTATQAIRAMAAINVITLVGAEFKALRAEFEALQSQFKALRAEFAALRTEFDALRSEFKMMRWMMGLIVVLLGGIFAALMTLIAIQLQEHRLPSHGVEAQAVAPTAPPVETSIPDRVGGAPAAENSDGLP